MDTTLIGRDDFLWSSMFHGVSWGAPFKYENIEESIHLAKRLGQNMIRIDCVDDFVWLDKVIKLYI